MNTAKNNFICYDCVKLKKCKEKSTSWVFFFLALLATISIRFMNIALDFSVIAAKILWYTGVIGFLLFFLYKFNYDNMLQKELRKIKLTERLLGRESLSEHDYDILATILCKLSSKKDKINYFFILLRQKLQTLILG